MFESQIVRRSRLERATPRAVERRLHELLDAGARLRPAGAAQRDSDALLWRYRPRHEVRLFGCRYFLTRQFQDDDIGFLIGYVALEEGAGVARRVRSVWPRLFYKDLSLVWRVGTHLIETDDDKWIGKGDVKWAVIDGEELLCSAEETTNLPLEIQGALDDASRAQAAVEDGEAARLVLRNAPSHRIEPYADFTRPRRRAQAAYAIHGGRRVAWFERPGDPASLVFAAGYEPDFAAGVLGFSRSASRLYGGSVRKYRILSLNRRIQFSFFTGPRHVWLNPPQALSTELSTYGVRTLDVECDEELWVPGYEYHYYDRTVDPPELHSQIPAGYVGEVCALDEYRCDASPWIEELPVVQAFRRAVLGRPRS